MEFLELIEWHDLPLDTISISETSVTLDVCASIDDLKSYRLFKLTLLEFTNISIDINSSFGFEALKDLEIAKFDYEVKGSEISGSIGILPGNAGYWSITFTDAKWSLIETT